jgi:heat shock protein HslJ
MKALILTLLLSGCSLLALGGASASLDGEWQLQAGTNQGGAVPIVAGSQITLKIDGTQVGGTAACNQYAGKIHVSGTTISITELIQTEMACLDDRLMASESAYLGALPRVTTAGRNGDSLVLTGPEVELRFGRVAPVAYVDLIGTTWTLDSLISGDAVSSTVGDATLELSGDGRISAATGCRDVTGTYTIVEGQVQVTLDPYDMIGCLAPLGDQDARILDVLSNGFGVSIDGDRLTMTAGDKGLGYRAQD